MPLVNALCSAKNPSSAEEWLKSRTACAQLQALASGALDLTHEALSALPPSSPWCTTTCSWLRQPLFAA